MKGISGDESTQPCLRTSPTNNNSSLISALSSSSQRRPDCARRCIVFLLLNAVFIFAVFLAFFLGKWLADQRAKNVTISTEEFRIHTLDLSTTKWPPKFGASVDLENLFPKTTTIRSNENQKGGNISSKSPKSRESMQNSKRTALMRNFTLADVVPPALQHLDVVEAIHGWGAKQDSEEEPTILTSLPRHIIPLHYDITLDVSSIPNGRFASMSKTTSNLLLWGNVSIQISVLSNSTDPEFYLHTGRRMNIHRLRLFDSHGRSIPIQSVKKDDSKKMSRFLISRKLPIASYSIHLEYSAPLCTEDGLVCSVVNYQNGTSLLESVTTKFEPTYARNVFPCWDEPNIKATFNMTLIHPNWLIGLSNMPLSSRIAISRGLNGKDIQRASISRFERTPPMSAYLVGFAVGDWIPLESRSGSGIEMRVWVGRTDAADGTAAAQLAPILLERIENDFQIAFPLPKLDIISARSFPVGGIENWGLVIIDSGALLTPSDIHGSLNLTVDRLFHEYRIEKIVAHEIAHQWFGDLVSVKSWDELWLSEGLTCHLVEELMEETHPLLSHFDSISRLADMTRLQSLSSAPSLVRILSTEEDVERSFHSSHLYTKGSVLLRMITHFISDFDFTNSLQKYLNRFGHGSADRGDLFSSLPWGALHGAEPLQLSLVLEPWLINPGIPEVIVSRSYETSLIRIWQRRASLHRYTSFLNDSPNGYDEAFSIHSRDSRDVKNEKLNEDSIFGTQIPILEKEKKRTRKPRPRNRNKGKKQKSKSKEDEMMMKDQQRLTRKISSDLWVIPFSYMFGTMKSTEGQIVREFWLTERSVSWADVELSPTEALIANPDWKFPYRVNYDRQNWKMIARLLHRSSESLPSSTRMQLLTDAEVYLAHSDVPHLYIYILGYLSEERDLGVALLGLDAVYRLADSFKGSTISSSLLSYFTPVISQLDRLLQDSQNDPELAALWLVEPTRLSKLYQLRCATNTSTCDSEKETTQWVASGGAAAEDVHRQATALCHSLSGRPTQEEISLVWSQLSSEGWSVGVQLAACSNDSKLTAEAASKVVATRNAAVYASALQSDFSLHYNRMFRTVFWEKMGELSILERVVLFSSNLTEPRPASTVLLHSVRTHEELRLVRGLISDWGGVMGRHMEWMERLLLWQSSVSRSLHEFFLSDQPNQSF